MDTEQRQHLMEMRQAYLKRLRVLELKEAQQGLDVPPHVITEICELRNKIDNIDILFTSLAPTSSDSSNNTTSPSVDGTASTRKRVEVVFQGHFDELTPEIQKAAIRALAAVMEIPYEQVIVVSVKQGSVIFQIEVPDTALKKLLALYQNNDPIITELGIFQINTITIEASGILVAIGRDRPGLANTVAAFIRACGCTIDDAEMETLRAYFAVLLRFCGTNQAVEKVRNEARTWGDNQGLEIKLYDDLPAATLPPDALPYELRVDAIERIGIIDDLTRALPGYGVNIRQLDSRIKETAMTGALRYELNALLQIPASKIDDIRDTLDALGLDYVLTPHRS